MAIPTVQLDNNTYHMHLIIQSDISTLDKTQIPLDLFFDAILVIEQVCLMISRCVQFYSFADLYHIILVPSLRQSKISQLQWRTFMHKRCMGQQSRLQMCIKAITRYRLVSINNLVEAKYLFSSNRLGPRGCSSA